MKTSVGFVWLFIVMFSLSSTTGCIISIHGDDDDDDSWNNTEDNHSWDNDDDDSRIDENGCYGDTHVGCSHLSWSDVEWAIELLYLFGDTYKGYTREEALELAREVYVNGIYPEAYLEIIAVHTTGGDHHRAFVVATDESGYPAAGLTTEDFELEIEGGDPVPPARVRRLEDLSSSELQVDISVVIDDSGSVRDCDANFVSEGLAYLFDTLPPVYNAELIKFESDVYLAGDWTSDGSELAQTMLNYCTDRGATALWDAVYEGIQDLPDDGDLKTVVVFTDGLDNFSSHTYEQVVQAAKENGVPVLVVALGSADILTLFNLALNTGGGFVYIPSGEEILDAFKTLTAFVTDAFVIEWDTDVDFDSVKIRARLEDDDTMADTFVR
ncbi:MAG: VWA domain-containing protein [Deltaproteobacteria bacterium]|nr:VWA domain-containing protein [Deltaproteobacteria bacterium]